VHGPAPSSQALVYFDSHLFLLHTSSTQLQRISINPSLLDQTYLNNSSFSNNLLDHHYSYPLFTQDLPHKSSLRPVSIYIVHGLLGLPLSSYLHIDAQGILLQQSAIKHFSPVLLSLLQVQEASPIVWWPLGYLTSSTSAWPPRFDNLFSSLCSLSEALRSELWHTSLCLLFGAVQAPKERYTEPCTVDSFV